MLYHKDFHFRRRFWLEFQKVHISVAWRWRFFDEDSLASYLITILEPTKLCLLLKLQLQMAEYWHKLIHFIENVSGNVSRSMERCSHKKSWLKTKANRLLWRSWMRRFRNVRTVWFEWFCCYCICFNYKKFR